MKTLMIAGALATGLLLAPAAQAAERLNDGLMGAAAGALVGGPVGAIAGGAIGYTAGPRIGHSLGTHRHYRHHRTYRHRHYRR
jgi:hypothetical protein